MDNLFTRQLDDLTCDLNNIMYAINKSDNLPNFIDQHKDSDLTAYQIKRMFEKCKYVRNKYSSLFDKIDNNHSKKDIYILLMDNMLLLLDNIYDLYFVSDINNVHQEYPNQNKKSAQRNIIRLIKKNMFRNFSI